MKNWLKSFRDSRVCNYLIYQISFLIFYKIAGFEYTVIILLGTILGEIHYQYKNDTYKRIKND